MTREEARKAAEVMMAYADGKDIEFRKFGDTFWSTVSIKKVTVFLLIGINLTIALRRNQNIVHSITMKSAGKR